VVLIVYMAAFVMPKGINMMQMFGGELPACMKVEVRQDTENILRITDYNNE
jgi:hypothetical protein